jgi:hypothetical protein
MNLRRNEYPRPTFSPEKNLRLGSPMQLSHVSLRLIRYKTQILYPTKTNFISPKIKRGWSLAAPQSKQYDVSGPLKRKNKALLWECRVAGDYLQNPSLLGETKNLMPFINAPRYWK